MNRSKTKRQRIKSKSKISEKFRSRKTNSTKPKSVSKMNRNELDGLAVELGLKPTDYKNKGLIIKAINKAQKSSN